MLSPTTTLGVAVFLMATSGAGSFVTFTEMCESLLFGLVSSGLLTCALLSTDGMPAARAVVWMVIAGAWALAASAPGKAQVMAWPAPVLQDQPLPAATESRRRPAGTVSVTVSVLSVASLESLLTSSV